MFEFIKKCFFTSATFIICNFLNVNSLECFSANDQKCEVRSEIINITLMNQFSIPIVLKQISTKEVVIQSMIRMLKYVFLTTLQTQISKYLILCQELMKQDT